MVLTRTVSRVEFDGRNGVEGRFCASLTDRLETTLNMHDCRADLHEGEVARD